MIQLEARMQQRYPRWFDNRRARLARPLLRTLAGWSRIDRVDAFIAGQPGLSGLDFVRAALAHLRAGYTLDEAALARIPTEGALLVVANHPSGALDAFALLDAIGRVRGDVRIVANEWLAAIEGMRPLLLPVRVLGGRAGIAAIRAIDQALARGECVIVFPAGEVSRLSPRGVRDRRWRPGVIRMAQARGAPVLPIRVQARNSALFYGASTIFKPIGTALLAREMFARGDRRIRLHVGEARMLPADARQTPGLLCQLRAELYRLGREQAGTPEATPVAAAEAPARVAADVTQLAMLGSTADGKEIRVGGLAAGSALMREIGRLRETTFRAVGEGTGRDRDLDAYDAWYEHIVLWDPDARAVAGAYRVARGARVLADKGVAGFYTASLFHYAESAVPRLAAGMELGRSFVAPQYWNSRSLDYLWQGIGAYLQAHPDVRYLFGPVSISAALPEPARDALVGYYSRYFGGGDGLARSLHPFAYVAPPPEYGDVDAATAFRLLQANLGALGSRVPTLYKQYTELCEPGGTRFLAFGVDPAFSNAVDGLIELDLQAMRPKKRERYLRRKEAHA